MSRKCPACGIENEDNQWRCGACGTTLIDEREILYPPKCYNINDKTDFIGFFKKNSTLFVVLGVFAALSFYLTTIVSNKGNYRLLIFQNLTNICVNPGNISEISNTPSFYGNISIINDPLQLTPWTGVNTITALQMGILSSFMIFFVVLFVIAFELMKIESKMKWCVLLLLDFLVASVLIYLVNTYSIQILIIVLMLISVAVIFAYFKNYLLLKKGFDYEEQVGKYVCLNVFSWILSVVMIVELGYLFSTHAIIQTMVEILGESLVFILFLIVPFVIMGIVGGTIMTVFLFQIEKMIKIKIPV